MINPAEDIVNLWLQECHNHFTMTNIVIRKKPRIINGKKIHGGRGKEVDIVSTDGSKFFWVEVGVSARPYSPLKAVRVDKCVSDAKEKFTEEKEMGLKERFNKRDFKKWYVYSPKLFSKSTDEEQLYRSRLKQSGINPISFTDVLSELREKLNYMGYDATRNYLFLLKEFRYF